LDLLSIKIQDINMNVKTLLNAMIVMIMAIGLINTYTSNGADYLTVDFQNGRCSHSDGYQTMTSNGYTVINRDVTAQGKKVSLSATSFDNSGNVVAITASAKRQQAGVSLDQTVYMIDGEYYTGVGSLHYVSADGKHYNVVVYTRAGNAYTLVDLSGKKGFAGVIGAAGSGSIGDYSGTGQYIVCAHSMSKKGESYVVGSGDIVGGNLHTFTTGDTTQTFVEENGEMIYMAVATDYNHRGYLHTHGYVYAVDTPETPAP
jgi:hypothetical protein